MMRPHLPQPQLIITLDYYNRKTIWRETPPMILKIIMHFFLCIVALISPIGYCNEILIVELHPKIDSKRFIYNSSKNTVTKNLPGPLKIFHSMEKSNVARIKKYKIYR